MHLHEFKAKVGLEAVRGAKTINEIAQDYEVHTAQVSQWKREPQPVSAHSAPERLYGEIGRLKMELDWLKKSQRSACRESVVMDCLRQHGELKAPMCAGRCSVRQRVCVSFACSRGCSGPFSQASD